MYKHKVSQPPCREGRKLLYHVRQHHFELRKAVHKPGVHEASGWYCLNCNQPAKQPKE